MYVGCVCVLLVSAFSAFLCCGESNKDINSSKSGGATNASDD